ncbi:Gonadotropin-releasing hormone II receptor [Halotydeus destructor]|nr:Gonadotropin-releasing hormone II receptor [Halotydeus destructor]
MDESSTDSSTVEGEALDWTNEMRQEFEFQMRKTLFAVTSRAKVEMYIYSFMFVISVTGNVSAMVNLLSKENRKKRINKLVIHLSIADLMVTFFTIPFEVWWRFTVTWKGGILGCKVLQVLRMFGLYLSSMVLVAISIDRYYAIVHPLRVNYVSERNRRLLAGSWITSLLFSLPQGIVYNVQSHPFIPDYAQCVTFGFFPEEWMMKAYNFLCLIGLYFGPLIVIIGCYAQITKVIFSKSEVNDTLQTKETASRKIRKQSKRRYFEQFDDASNGYRVHGPRAGSSEVNPNNRSAISSYIVLSNKVRRAKRRTVRMTVTIIVTFLVCWTPYVVVVSWYQLDEETAKIFDQWFKDGLFTFAVANSCVNPLVYGSHIFKAACQTTSRKCRQCSVRI